MSVESLALQALYKISWQDICNRLLVDLFARSVDVSQLSTRPLHKRSMKDLCLRSVRVPELSCLWLRSTNQQAGVRRQIKTNSLVKYPGLPP